MAGGPLEGVRVVDMTTIVVGPIGGRVVGCAALHRVAVERTRGRHRDGVMRMGRRRVVAQLRIPCTRSTRYSTMKCTVLSIPCFAARSNALLGTQPLLRHSPPILSASISATFSPNSAQPPAAVKPAAPAPITITSCVNFMPVPETELAWVATPVLCGTSICKGRKVSWICRKFA